MKTTISTPVLGTFTFFAPDDGGYLRVDTNGQPGTLGEQCCQGGRTMGLTIRVTPETFKAEIKRWIRARGRHSQ